MNNEPHNVSLPQNLRRQFALLERRLWKIETAQALGCALAGLLGSFLVLFISDRVWDSPIWLRVLIFLAGISVAIFAGLRWARLWIFKRRDLRDFSELVQRRFRRLGDRLLGIVELSAEQKHSHNFSPELYAAAIQQVADEAAKFDFTEAVENRDAKKSAILATALFVFALLPFLLEPQLSGNVFHRWIAPSSKIPRYTLVRFAGLPEKMIIPHGESFSVSGTVEYASKFWKPRIAKISVGEQFKSKAAVKDATSNPLEFQLPGQVQNGVLQIKLGDARHEIAMEPTHRPALRNLAATIQLPAYLRYPPIEEKISSGSLSLLDGSDVSFRGKISRDLKSAWLNTGKNSQPLKIEGEDFSSDLVSTTNAGRFEFLWQDTLGLSNSAPWKLNVQLQKDQPPAPDLPGLSRDIAILQSDVLNIKALAKDDFGVRDVGLSWQPESPTDDSAEWGTTEIRLQKNSAKEKKVEELFQWSPAIFQIPADVSVQLVAFATDYLPGRERVESPVHRIHVLGNQKHADLVRQNLESVLARVEEVARLQEKLLASTEELHEQAQAEAEDAKNSDAKNPSAKRQEKLSKMSEEQNQNSRTLENLSREGMETLREALKNPIFKEQALQEWSKTLQQMQQLSQQQMKQAGQNLKSAQQNSNSPKSQQKNLADAKQQEKEALEQLEKIQGKVNKGLDDLQALTLSERLRKLSGTETEIGGELKKMIPEVIGLTPKELPDRFKRAGSKLANTQDDAHQETKKLQAEINRFFERTQKTNYGSVSKEMTEARAADEMDRMREFIQENVAMEASRNLTIWSKRFNDWAEKLQPPENESQSGGGGQGQGGGDQMNMTKTLIALLRLREKELNLHNQTRLLEEQRSNMKNYGDRAKEILENHKGVSSGLKEIEQANQIPMLAQPYKQALDSLGKAEEFLKIPETGKLTADAQLKSIELLTDAINLINEQAKRNPPPQNGQSESESQDMAFLMQMMAPGMGSKPGMSMGGGNTSGGSTDRASNTHTGDASGQASEQRDVKKASGAAGTAVPSEFRETLENYFKALEQEQSR